MKKAKVMAVAMVLMLGLGACGNSQAGNAESSESVETAQAVSETGSGKSGNSWPEMKLISMCWIGIQAN